MMAFFIGLFLACASTLMYEVVLTRLLSVISWYYLAFVAVSMAMFGMTFGALAVQLKPDLFRPPQVPRRLAQSTFAMAISMPLTLLTMLAVPIDVSLSAQVLYSFFLFSAIIAVPFFLSGITVCLSLTKSHYPIGRVYFVDLAGAAAGCFGAVGLLNLIDAPSAVLVISALLGLSAAAYASHAGDDRQRTRSASFAFFMLALAALNASTLYGIQPIWTKGKIDRRTNLLAEVWNPISKVRVLQPEPSAPGLWGPSPRTPEIQIESIFLDIDNYASTIILPYRGRLQDFDFLRYDVTSLAAQLRKGGEAAIIGMGGGRDVLNAAVNDFRRIVAIEVNTAIVRLTTNDLAWFSGLPRIPGLEVHVDEGRSYLTREGAKFDLIQASLVDTWAATSAGAMTLSENSLYTVDGWQVFYRHLKPGGLISFSRWNFGPEAAQTHRLFSVAWATLLLEGVAEPARHIALVGSGEVATLLLCNQPLSVEDIRRIETIAGQMEFKVLFLPGKETRIQELRAIASARTLDALLRFRYTGLFDYSPTFDSSPFFFNSLRLSNIPELMRTARPGGNLRALVFLLCFMVAAAALVTLTIVLPLKPWAIRQGFGRPGVSGGIAYFVAIGLGFMLIEIGMMQQLTMLLGHPTYSLVVVLAGLIFSTGVGSLISERLRFSSSLASRLPAWMSALTVIAYAALVLPVLHRFVAGLLWQRVAVCLALIVPCGFAMGFCFPVGLRWMTRLKQEENLPWMWALNGSASVLASFLAIVISMETSITASVLTGAGFYLAAGAALPGERTT